ncbi:MAG: (2Fe-2S)-binding protein [Trebonia sp.]
MFACICNAVSSEEVSAAIDDGAATVEAVSDATGACTGCGTCWDRIETMIGERSRRCPLAARLVA